MKYKIMSFNIKCDEKFKELENQYQWENRKNGLVEEIISQMPDIIGLQEVMKNQQQFILKNLNENYTSIFQDRDDEAVNSEGTPIYYNKHKFNLLSFDTFWLSETPNVKASTSWNSRWPRVCTYALLEDKISKNKFAFFNTHLDHKSEEAREKGITLILDKINEINLATILTGDFNCSKNEKTIDLCNRHLINANIKKDNSITFHLWNHPELLINGKTTIDYIFLKDFKPLNYYVLNNVKDAVKNSDHFAILSEVELYNQ